MRNSASVCMVLQEKYLTVSRGDKSVCCLSLSTLAVFSNIVLQHPETQGLKHV